MLLGPAAHAYTLSTGRDRKIGLEFKASLDIIWRLSQKQTNKKQQKTKHSGNGDLTHFLEHLVPSICYRTTIPNCSFERYKVLGA